MEKAIDNTVANKDIIARATAQRIAATAPNKDVIAAAPIEFVVSRAAAQDGILKARSSHIFDVEQGVDEGLTFRESSGRTRRQIDDYALRTPSRS